MTAADPGGAQHQDVPGSFRLLMDNAMKSLENVPDGFRGNLKSRGRIRNGDFRLVMHCLQVRSGSEGRRGAVSSRSESGRAAVTSPQPHSDGLSNAALCTETAGITLERLSSRSSSSSSSPQRTTTLTAIIPSAAINFLPMDNAKTPAMSDWPISPKPAPCQLTHGISFLAGLQLSLTTSCHKGLSSGSMRSWESVPGKTSLLRGRIPRVAWT